MSWLAVHWPDLLGSTIGGAIVGGIAYRLGIKHGVRFAVQQLHGTVETNKIEPGAVQVNHLAPGSVINARVAIGAVKPHN